ncbi:MAG: FAD-binding oxidoreductase, partial [Myxococcales bacterium]|nr:FAD-binding oxidoreductase [Myxococcales bacterium]
QLEILTASGEIVACGPDLEPELFWATVGGLGLTGVILTVELTLRPVAGPWIVQEAVRTEDLDDFFRVSAESADFSHTVTWIDCVTGGKGLGRGIMMRGRHAPPGVEGDPGMVGKAIDALSPLMHVPVDGPSWLLNKATIRLFNEAYFRKQPRGQVDSVIHYIPFFFPLDFVKDWNRIYG